MSHHARLTLFALMLAAILSAAPARQIEAAAGPQVTGVWACDATRPGSLVARPLVFVFHADGNFSYTSQTTVQGGPLSLPFTSRGGGYGQWQKIGSKDYAYRARENMYIDGNAGGFFYVDSTLRLDPKAGTLCSGRPECPSAETKIRLTQFTFAADGSITGEIDLLPAGSEAVVICRPMGSVFPGLP
jgi:hypothetical protein